MLQYVPAVTEWYLQLVVSSQWGIVFHGSQESGFVSNEMPNTAMDHAAILNDDKLVDSCAPRKAGGKLPIVNGNVD